MSKIKQAFAILILLTILILQSYVMYNRSSVGYMFNKKNNVENNNVEYTMIAMSSNIVKNYITDDGKIAFLSSYVGGKYGIGIAYYYYMYNLLPLNVINDSAYAQNFEKITKHNLELLFTDYKAKYYIIFGKNVSLKNIITANDINLYKVSDANANELEKVIDFGYDLYSMFSLTEDKNKFINDCSIFEDMINAYWNFDSIDIIRNFAISLYDNGYYKEAKQYLEYYYNTVDTLVYDIDFRIGNIAFDEGNYLNAIKYYQSALNSVGCDQEYINSKIAEIELKVTE